MDPFLTTFLIINAILAGVAATIGVQHALAHFKPKEEKKPTVESLPKMLPAMKKELLDEAEATFRKQIAQSTAQLEKDLVGTTTELSAHVTKIGGEIIAVEMKRYRDSLEALRVQTEQIIKQAQTSVSEHQSNINERIDGLRGELEAKMKADLEAEKAHLSAQIDTKLADAVSSFLLDTLQHNVDLGAQTDYMISVLEAHKDDIAKEVRSGV